MASSSTVVDDGIGNDHEEVHVDDSDERIDAILELSLSDSSRRNYKGAYEQFTIWLSRQEKYMHMNIEISK